MTDIFADSKIRLSQAKRHIIALKREIRAFLEDYAKKSYVIEDDPSDGSYVLHKIKITKPPAEEIIAYAVDAIDNLRAALDLAWWNLAVTAGFIAPIAEAYFPFADNVSKFDRMLRLGFKNFSQEILAVPMGFKPNEGGDDLLFALNRIAATNKHRLLPLKIVRLRKVEGQFTKWGLAELPEIMEWDRGKNEIVIIRADRYADIDSNLILSLDIAFHESVKVVGGQPVVATLNALVDKVENILEALEGAARVLGFIT